MDRIVIGCDGNGSVFDQDIAFRIHSVVASCDRQIAACDTDHIVALQAFFCRIDYIGAAGDLQIVFGNDSVALCRSDA